MAWADLDYKYKKKITIPSSKVTGDEVNFPIVVNVTDTDLKSIGNGGHVQSANGFDICFYDGTETTKYYHELELYTAATGVVTIWVCITSLSSTSNNIIWMYYGNPTISTNQSSTSTWDSNYALVYHLDEASTPAYDSTANARNGTWTNSPTQNTSSKIGSGIHLSNGVTSSCINFTDFAITDRTLECWVNFDEIIASRLNVVTYNYNSTSTAASFSLYLENSTTKKITFTYANAETIVTDIVVATGTWYHCAQDYKSSTKFGNAWVDSVNKGTLTTAADTNANVVMGPGYSNVNGMHGLADEFRISTTNRGVNWITTGYVNQNEPTTFTLLDLEKTITKLELFLESKLINQGNMDVYIDTSNLQDSCKKRTSSVLSYKGF